MKLTPKQILEKYPQLEMDCHWKITDFGVMLRCHLLRGHYDSQRRQSMIEEESLLELIKTMNCNLDNGKVDVDD